MENDIDEANITSTNTTDGNCSKCDTAIEDNWVFCPICSTKLKEIRCSNCGNELVGTENFCPDCGTNIPDRPPK